MLDFHEIRYWRSLQKAAEQAWVTVTATLCLRTQIKFCLHFPLFQYAWNSVQQIWQDAVENSWISWKSAQGINLHLRVYSVTVWHFKSEERLGEVCPFRQEIHLQSVCPQDSQQNDWTVYCLSDISFRPTATGHPVTSAAANRASSHFSSHKQGIQ